MKISRYRIIFLGTPSFAVSSLLNLIKHQYDVIACITQPDRKSGRGNTVSFSDVKKAALLHEIPVLQPTRIKKPFWIDKIRQLNPTLLITCAYGQMLPKELLDIPELGCINIHASLLPAYRGASPITRAILNGERVTGVTTMMTDEGMDTGDMLLKKTVEITDEMTFSQLHDLLSEKGSELIIETLMKLEEGSLVPIKQDDSKATYAPMIRKEDGLIDWDKDSYQIHNQVRAFNPWPGSFTSYKGKKLKILKTAYDDSKNAHPCGAIISTSRDMIEVACQKGVLVIKQLQFENKKAMDVSECYHNMETGIVLGSEV